MLLDLKSLSNTSLHVKEDFRKGKDDCPGVISGGLCANFFIDVSFVLVIASNPEPSNSDDNKLKIVKYHYHGIFRKPSFYGRNLPVRDTAECS
jgi:hypothetical protein